MGKKTIGLYTKVEYLEKIATYYVKTHVLHNKYTWFANKNRDMLNWEGVLKLFNGRKSLKRKIKYHINKRVWNLEKIKVGFSKFYEKHRRYPTAIEIDNFPDLPSSRNIQRYWGGLTNLRKLLQLEITDYSKGSYRSKWAGVYTSEAINSEKEVRKYLENRYYELCVHEEKRYGDGKNAMDFFIYAEENFGVDVFKTSNYHNLAKNINIKLDKYKDFPYKLFFVVIGDIFEQTKIDNLMSNKKDKPLLDNMTCITMKNFVLECEKIKPLDINFEYQKIR